MEKMTKDNAEKEINHKTTNTSQDLNKTILGLQDQIIREKAENENIRKRFYKELENTRKFAISNFVKDLTEQVENLFRVSENTNIEVHKSNNELKTLLQGIEITKKNLLKVFQDFQIQRIYPINQIFDHRLHEAISQVVDDTKDPNTVVNVIQAGYSISDRLIKPAIVVVTKSESSQSS